ncbi:unnamed protein product [Linum tenue]|nr:unnamed protein product [Linum tenue]
MSNNAHGSASCCRIPGADFFSSKLWRKADTHNPTPRLSSSRGISSLAGMRPMAGGRTSSVETFNLDNCRLRLQHRGGLIVNPLAEIHDSRRGLAAAGQQ